MLVYPCNYVPKTTFRIERRHFNHIDLSYRNRTHTGTGNKNPVVLAIQECLLRKGSIPQGIPFLLEPFQNMFPGNPIQHILLGGNEGSVLKCIQITASSF